MSPCPFTPYVSLYQGPDQKLEKHLGRCHSCRTAAQVLVAHQAEPADQTSECPDPATLAAYNEDLLTSEEHEQLSGHIGACAYCTQELLAANRALGDPSEAESALGEGSAYVLAKRYVQNRYPEARDTYDEHWDQMSRSGELWTIRLDKWTSNIPMAAFGKPEEAIRLLPAIIGIAAHVTQASVKQRDAREVLRVVRKKAAIKSRQLVAVAKEIISLHDTLNA